MVHQFLKYSERLGLAQKHEIRGFERLEKKIKMATNNNNYLDLTIREKDENNSDTILTLLILETATPATKWLKIPAQLILLTQEVNLMHYREQK